MSRDTQFQGFAKALTDELIKYLTSRSGLTLDEIEQEWNKVIARRAYDFACHIIGQIGESDASAIAVDLKTSEDIVCNIFDMTELPKEQGS